MWMLTLVAHQGPGGKVVLTEFTVTMLWLVSAWWQCNVDVDSGSTPGSRWEGCVDRVHGHHVVVSVCVVAV